MAEHPTRVYPSWQTDLINIDEKAGIFIRGTIGESDKGGHYRIDTVLEGQIERKPAYQEGWSLPSVFVSEAAKQMRDELLKIHISSEQRALGHDVESCQVVVDRSVSYRVHLPDLEKKRLREPDTWWAHLPVVRGGVTDLGDMWAWHKSQLEQAIATVSAEYPDGTRLIPKSGFYVRVGRWHHKHTWEERGDLITRVSIAEDETRPIMYPKHVRTSSDIVGLYDRAAPDTLGTDYNPLPRLLEEVIEVLPQRWAEYLTWRARHRREPEAEWLIKLRAENAKQNGERLSKPNRLGRDATPALIAGVTGSEPVGWVS